MQEKNSNIPEAEIIVGIPSYKEGDSISFVVQQVDKGLVKYFPNKKSLIVNVDNNSPDNTKEAFLNTETITPKIYITTPEGVKGKGNNLYNLFLLMQKTGAKVGVTVDADLKSINPEWINCFVNSILKGYDFLTPLYYRHKYDATITNHICFPLVYSILGYNIRQPIGGDMAFSGKMSAFWLNEEWQESVRQYGIDIFMTLGAIKSGNKLGQVNLVAKIHKPSAPKLGPMFLAVSQTIFDFLVKNQDIWRIQGEVVDVPIVCEIDYSFTPQNLEVNLEQIKKTSLEEFHRCYPLVKKYLSDNIIKLFEKVFLQEKLIEMDALSWAETVLSFLDIYAKEEIIREKIIELLRGAYFARIYSFVKEVEKKSNEETEKAIKTQAEVFRDKAKELFSTP